MDNYELSNQYLYPGFPNIYREFVLNYMQKEEEITLKIFHEMFGSGLHVGKTMLDFGCGPTIHNIASASKYFSNIILSEYAPENREALQKWLSADPQCLDWAPLLEVVSKLEGYSDTTKGVKEIEERIRKKVTSIIQCDALQEEPLPSHIKDLDLLLTSGCLEGCCPTLEIYKSMVKKLGSYVRQGGSMIMIVGLKVNVVAFAGGELKCLNVDLETVENAFKEAGFTKERLLFYQNEGNESVEYSGFILIAGVKN